MKKYNIKHNIGRAKYVVNYYNGKKHNDDSEFWDIKIFSNKRGLTAFIKSLKAEGYVEN
jgi:hypothetical protein